MSKELWEAAKQGRVDVVRAILDRGVPVDARNERGSTALMTAAGMGHTDVLRLLLERGADVNA